ncbi:MAG TPA: hypothetical protein VML19_03375 [Verrucomicrobiae bacterium]|nr:hypothetical protein [Verrucomicrobiae bacterium]
MFRKLFRSADLEDDAANNASQTAALAMAVADFSNPQSNTAHPVPGLSASFDQIYQHASSKPARLAYDILKVSEMLTSHHLAGMSQETKRASLLMALEAARVDIEDLLQDAVARQRALNDYEEAQRSALRDFEARKLEENRQIQAEIDAFTKEYMSRIQANLDDVARAQDELRNWQKQKQDEAQRITEAATYCVPPGAAASNGTMAAMLERATAGRR